MPDIPEATDAILAASPRGGFESPRRAAFRGVLIRLGRRVWLPVALLVVNRDWFMMPWTLPVVAAGFVVVVGYALLEYWRFTFRVADRKLLVTKGVLHRTALVVPFERIQSLDAKQGVLQRLLSVVQLDMVTAGSTDAEFSIVALSKPDVGELRQLVFGDDATATAEATPTTDDEIGGMETDHDTSSFEFALSTTELIKYGLTRSHLRSAGVIVSAIFGLLYGDDLFDHLYAAHVNAGKDWVVSYFSQFHWVSVVALVVVASILASVVVSVGMTLLRFHGFRLTHGPNGFRTQAGLLARQERVVADSKIQVVIHRKTLLMKLLGMASVRLKHARSSNDSGGNQLDIPGGNEIHADRLMDLAVPAARADSERPRWCMVSPDIVIRRTFVVGVLPALCIVPLLTWGLGSHALWFLLWIPCQWGLSQWIYRNYRYAVGHNVISTFVDVINAERKAVSIHKVQKVTLRQSLWARRHGVARLKLFTAGGSVTIPAIPLDTAQDIRDFLLYRLEAQPQAWM